MLECSFGGLICATASGARVRYRLHLHKAIVFPLSRTCLPRTWRGCHSELQDSPQHLPSHQPRISTTPLSICPSSPRLSSFSLLFSPFREAASKQASRQASKQASRYTLSTLPCLHSCISLHGGLRFTRFEHIRNAYSFYVKSCFPADTYNCKSRSTLAQSPKRSVLQATAVGDPELTVTVTSLQEYFEGKDSSRGVSLARGAQGESVDTRGRIIADL
jgi:hypothetical protein